MRRALFAFALAAASVGLSGAGHQAPPRLVNFSGGQRATLDRISAYLNSVRTLKSSFTQIDPNGDAEDGEFYLSKPGRMRFEYRPPVPTLIVSDGQTVAVRNSRLKTVDRYPLADTPLDLLLGDSIDLGHNLAVTGLAEQQGSIVVHARSQSSHAQGDIAITFAAQPLELRQWTVVDSQGLTTTVLLRDIQTGGALPGSLFVLRDEKSPFTRKGEE